MKGRRGFAGEAYEGFFSRLLCGWLSIASISFFLNPQLTPSIYSKNGPRNVKPAYRPPSWLRKWLNSWGHMSGTCFSKCSLNGHMLSFVVYETVLWVIFTTREVVLVTCILFDLATQLASSIIVASNDTYTLPFEIQCATHVLWHFFSVFRILSLNGIGMKSLRGRNT